MIVSFDPTFWSTITAPKLIISVLATGVSFLFLLVILKILARFWLIWRQSKYRETVKFITLAIEIPPAEIKNPKAVENIVAQLYAIKSKFNFYEKWWKGQYILQASLEIIGQDGYVQFIAYLPVKYQTLFESAVYAQYPDAHIIPIEDYTSELKTESLVTESKKTEETREVLYDLWGTEFQLTQLSFFPIRSYPLFEHQPTGEFTDPLAAVLEMMSHLKKGERFWYQITLTPTRMKWQEAGSKEIRNIVEGIVKHKPAHAPLRRFLQEVLTAFEEVLLGTGKPAEKKAPNFAKIMTMVPPHAELIVKSIREKISRLGFSCFIRAVYFAPIEIFDSRQATGDFQGVMRQLANPQMNSLASDLKIEVDYPKFFFPKFRMKWRKKRLLRRAKQRYSGIGVDKPSFWSKLKGDDIKSILSLEELATLWHFPLPDLADKGSLVKRVSSKKVHPKQLVPQSDLADDDNIIDSEINFFAQTNFRRLNQRFGIKKEDRRRHMYVIGKTGMGKTTLLENMIYQDIIRGEGVAVIDPHGDLVESVIDLIPPYRINDVIYFNPADKDFPVAFNMLEEEDINYRYLVASALVGIFKKIWANSWGPRLEYLLRNSLLTLLETTGNTILGVPRLFVDNNFRKRLVTQLKDPVVRTFWTNEYAKYNQTFQVEAISPIQNKIGQFISIPIIRNIIGQVKSKINFREILDEKKIFLVNLAKGLIGEDVSSLLGATIISKLQIAAMMRADKSEAERTDFYLYIDEFQNFSTESFATILSEARKYRLNLIMAHQYIAQLEELVAAAVFGNVGTMVCFGVGAEDAATLEPHFEPEFILQDLVNLGKYEIILRLMIDCQTSRPFSAETLPPLGAKEVSSRDKIIKISRERYTVGREVIEDKLKRWLE